MTRPDHYATLGVPKDASLADIKRAYRKLAREAHPDNGGSNERMQALNAAKEVLYDEARRADYDAGGDGGADSLEEDARELIAGLFSEAIAKNVMNPFQATMGGLRKGLEELRGAISTQNAAIMRMECQIGRVVSRKKGSGNMFNEIIRKGIAAAEKNIVGLERQVEVAELAIKLLGDEYQPATDFMHTPPKPEVKAQFLTSDWLGDRFKF